MSSGETILIVGEVCPNLVNNRRVGIKSAAVCCTRCDRRWVATRRLGATRFRQTPDSVWVSCECGASDVLATPAGGWP